MCLILSTLLDFNQMSLCVAGQCMMVMEITGGQVTPCWRGWRTLGTGHRTMTPGTMMCIVTIMIPWVTRVTMAEITTLRQGADIPGPGIPRTEATPPMVTPIRMVTINIIRTSFTTTGSRGTTRSTRGSPLGD